MNQVNTETSTCLLCGKQIAVINCTDCGGAYCASCAPLVRSLGESVGRCDDCNWKLIEEQR